MFVRKQQGIPRLTVWLSFLILFFQAFLCWSQRRTPPWQSELHSCKALHTRPCSPLQCEWPRACPGTRGVRHVASARCLSCAAEIFLKCPQSLKYTEGGGVVLPGGFFFSVEREWLDSHSFALWTRLVRSAIALLRKHRMTKDVTA